MIDLCIWDHVLILLLTIVLPALALWRGRNDQPLPPFSPRDKIQLYYSNSAVLLLAASVILLLWWLCDRNLEDIGFRFVQPDRLSLFIAVGLLMLYVIDVVIEVGLPNRLEKTKKRWRDRTPFMPTSGREFAHFLVLAASAAVAEEIIFRGYFITYLLNLLGTSWSDYVISVLLPATVFAIVHLYQGRQAIFKILLLALPLGVIFLLTKSLFLLMLLHFVIDVLGGIVGMHLLQPTQLNESEPYSEES